ncbi:hypothetical protein R3I94_008062 [Phoxinus phoxinus]
MFYIEIRFSPEKTSKVITVCTLLHNMCRQRTIPQTGDRDEFDDDDDDNEHNQFVDEVEQCGLAFRDHFVHTHFGGDGLAPAAGLRGEAGDGIVERMLEEEEMQ